MRSPSDRPSPAGRPSWKQRGSASRSRPSSGGAGGGGKAIARGLLTLLLLVLIGGFAYWAWPRVRGERYFTATTIWATDPLTLPPLAFAREDLDALAQTPDVQFVDATGDGQDTTNFLAMIDKTARRPQSPKDLLLTYISAYGLPDETGPYLVASDFRRGSTTGRLPIRDLLDKLAISKAGAKVLILDAARLDVDARLGLFGNDFAAQALAEVKRHPAKDLWVLLSAGAGQGTSLTPGSSRSVFGAAIAAGLAGAATRTESGGDGDRFVDLGELARFAQRECTAWSGAELPDFQLPLLLRSGVGQVPEDAWPHGEAFRLLYVEPAESTAAEAPNTPQEPPAATPAEPDSKKSAAALRSPSRSPVPTGLAFAMRSLLQNEPPSTGSPAAPANSSGNAAASPPTTTPTPPTSPPTAAPPTAAPPAPASTAAPPAAAAVPSPAAAEPQPRTPRERERAELLRLWTLRDQLLQRRTENDLTPIDFAPHLWRELEAWLVYYEQRFLSGRIGDSRSPGDTRDTQESDLRRQDMRALGDDLEQLATAMRGSSVRGSTDEKSIGDRLLTAWERYAAEQRPRDRKLEQEADPILREARNVSRQLREQAYQAVYLARWQGRAAASGIATAAQRGALTAHLDEIAAGIRTWQRLEKSPIPASSPGELRQWLLTQATRAGQRRDLEEDLLAVEQETVRGAGQPMSVVRVMSLLATPILPAPRRAALWDAWTKKSTLPPSTSEPARSSGDTTSRWMKVRRETLQMEAKLIAFIDESAAKRIDVLAQAAAAGESSDAEQRRLLDASREALLFADGLPQALVHEWCLLLLDPRDVPQLDVRRVPIPTFRLELESETRLEVAPLANQLRLTPGKEGKLSVTVRATRENLLDARLSPTNADGLLAFELLPDEEPLPTERGWYSKRVHYRVTVRAEAKGAGKNSTQVAISATAGGLTAQSSVEVFLPRPDRVDILFSRLGVSAPPLSGDQVRLALFANRKTRFQCELVNRFDEPRTVTVTLYAVAPRPTPQTPIGRFDAAIKRAIYDASAQAFLDAKLVAKGEKPVELPAAGTGTAGEKRVTFNWVNPNAPAVPTPPAPGTAEPPPPANPSPAEPIHGLVVEVVDTKDTSKQWLSWIELEPLSPRDYLDVKVGYQQRLRQIVAELQPKQLDANGDPILPPGKPVWVEWDPSDAMLPSEGKKNLAGEIDVTAPTPKVVLTAEAEPDGQSRVVKLAVDGYPRAFRFLVPCRRDATAPELIAGRDLERDRDPTIKIESVTVPSQNRVYHFLPDFQPPPVPMDAKAPPIEHLGLAPRQAALFRAPAETLVVRLQADAPIDAFRSDSSDRVQVTLRENSFVRSIRSDRSFQATYESAGPRGVIELGSKIDDLELRLSPADLQNVQSAVDADIRFGEQSASNTVLVNLDGDNPRIDTLSLPATAPRDGMLTVRFVVTDYYGVGRVTYGFSKDGSPKLAEADAQSQVVTARQDDQRRHVFDLPLDLKDLPPGRRLFLAKVQDYVGHESPLVSRELIIAAPMPMATTGEIRGVLRYGPAKVNGSAFKVTIEGGELGPTPVEIGPDGSFLLPNLPLAEYTLKVLEGSFNGKSVPPKEQKGVKPTDPKKAQTMVLDVR